MLKTLVAILVVVMIGGAADAQGFGRGSRMGFAPHAGFAHRRFFAHRGFFPNRFFFQNRVFFGSPFIGPGFVVVPSPAYPFFSPYPFVVVPP